MSTCQTPHSNAPQPSVDQSMPSQSTPLSTDRSPASYQCKVLCSVTNGPEVHLQENHIYSCVAANPVSNHSTQLNIMQFCPQTERKCDDPLHVCRGLSRHRAEPLVCTCTESNAILERI
ncbi:hypothetical protein AOLI_G00191800 [Acnodon oligacanthus]